MKKNLSAILAALSGLCVMLYACSKESRNSGGDHLNASAALTQAARQWYAEHTPKQSSAQQKSPRRLTPIWDSAWTVEGDDHSNYLVVTAPEHHVANKDLSIRRFFVFQTEGNTVKDGYITELVGKQFDVSKNLELLLSRHRSSSIEGFSGAIFRYSMSYRSIDSKNFVNGEQKGSSTMSLLKMEDKLARKVNLPNTADCTPVLPNYHGFPLGMVGPDCTYSVFIEMTKDQNGCITSLNVFYTGHSCPDPNPGGGGDPGPGPGEGYSPPYGNIFTYVRDMRSDVASICFNRMYAFLFTSQGAWHREVSILANSLMPTPSLDIYIRLHESSSYPADCHVVPTLTGGELTLDIYLHPSLGYASKEWIASSIIHACQKGVLDAYNGWPMINSDYFTAYDYLVAHRTAMDELFPSLGSGISENLAMKGLETTVMYTTDVASDPVGEAALWDLWSNYRNRHYGTGTGCVE
ncbi:hypothetical protein ACWKWU_09430 [Chitinophaga lutea]